VLAVHAGAVAWLHPAACDPFLRLLLVALVVALGAGIVACYSLLRRGVHWFVDAAVPRRVDYVALHAAIAQKLAATDSADEALEEARRHLASRIQSRILRDRLLRF
jgi:hypothetical protein